MSRDGTPMRSETLRKLIWPVLALLLLLAYNFFFTPGFFRVEIRDGHLYGSLIDVLNRAAPVMLLALGMTLVIATGGVDLSVGAVMAISGAAAAYFIQKMAANAPAALLPLAVAIAVPLASAAAAGMWNGALVAVFGVQPIVATLILMVAGRGIAQLITDGQILTFEYKPFEFIGGGYLLGLPFTVTIVAATAVALALATRATALGLFIEAVGGNETASRFAGIRARTVKFMAYVLSGVCAGVAGLIVTSDIKGADANNAGLYLELDAILSVVIGGTALTGGRFYLAGSLIGAMLIQALTTTILSKGIKVEYTLVVKALVIIAVCLLQAEEFRARLGRALRGRAKAPGARA